jgi:acetoin:2,6-dichlorophenolindophenol oxidoreductase subunit alpha
MSGEIEILRTMWRIRRFEEQVIPLFQRGLIRGSTHVCIGQEATAAGACAALEPPDWITSTHRGHGHVIAKGADTGAAMAEVLGRATGTCKGKGGSMHIADLELGILGANGIVGGSLAIAAGAAFTSQVTGDGKVTLCFFGDGALAEGLFHEAATLAGLWRLPVIFLCEMNAFAEFTRAEVALPIPVDELHQRADGYGFPGVAVDGNDPLAVRNAVAEARARALGDEGPTLIVAHTYRLEGHNIGDPESYRTKEERRAARERDPIFRYGEVLVEQGLLKHADVERLDEEARAEAMAAVEFALASPLPDPAELTTDVYV